MKQIEKIVHKQIKNLLNENKRKLKITNQMILNEDLGFGSMTQIALFTNLTEKFKVDILQFEDEELINLRSVEDLISLFGKKVNEVEH